MEVRMDFLDRLGLDLSSKILMFLEDPSDLVRVSSVSRSWRHFVIANGLCQQFCLRMFPQLSRVVRVIELNKCAVIEPTVGSSYPVRWDALEKDHRVYAFLSQVCTSFQVRDCISKAICASSTDSNPMKGIENTLSPCRAFYWSSKGQRNPAVPETLIYELASEFCIITEINICPFQAYFQSGLPIYSAKSVRFRMGYPKSRSDVGKMGYSYPSADDQFIWTYTSQEFPMAQKNDMQKFKLPEPVLCIGGILQIELLGQVQRNEVDGLFYICMSYVQVVGRSLSPTFGVEILGPSGNFVLLIQNKLVKLHDQLNEPVEIAAGLVQSSARDLQHIVTMLGEM